MKLLIYSVNTLQPVYGPWTSCGFGTVDTNDIGQSPLAGKKVGR